MEPESDELSGALLHSPVTPVKHPTPRLSPSRLLVIGKELPLEYTEPRSDKSSDISTRGHSPFSDLRSHGTPNSLGESLQLPSRSTSQSPSPYVLANDCTLPSSSRDLTVDFQGLTKDDATISSLFTQLLAPTETPEERDLPAKGQFMPRGPQGLERLVNMDRVKQELERAGLESTPDRVRDICKCYSKIFALLAWKNRSTSIGHFIHEQFDDTCLPLGRDTNKASWRGKARLLLAPGDNEKQFWWDFKHFQWLLISPFFTLGDPNNVQEYSLHDSVILPFLSRSHRREGGYGEVSRVEIHPDHYTLTGPSERFCYAQSGVFAVKRLFLETREYTNKEVAALKQFTAFEHPHLISLLGTYTQAGKTNLIFHWANTDLNGFWETHRDPWPRQQTTLWLARQCLGIADGLALIHDPNAYRRNDQQKGTSGDRGTLPRRNSDTIFGRHGDLKPRNILWFKSPPGVGVEELGTLVISDFGAAELHRESSRSDIPNHGMMVSDTYCAPESHIANGEISRSYDIWSLGCVYLELLAWSLGGLNYVLEFGERRKRPESEYDGVMPLRSDCFFQPVRDRELMKQGIFRSIYPPVTEFIDEMRSHPASTKFTREFLHLIEKGMLVIETVSEKRLSSKEVHERLKVMVTKLEEQPYYGFTPKYNTF